MPVIVSPGFQLPADVDPVVSPDGRLTVILDAAHAGVLLRGNFSPEVVSFSRDVWWASSLSWSADAPEGWPGSFQSRPVSHTAVPEKETFPVTPGEKIKFSVWLKADKPGSRVYFEVRNQDDALLQGWHNTTGTNRPYPVERQEVPTEWTQFTSVSTVPAGNTHAYLRTIYFNHSSGDERTATVSVSGLTVTRLETNPVHQVRFERSDGTIVRSGDPAWAPGGWAHAYDHEATLGGGTSWRAVSILADGTEGTPSDYVTAAIPALTDGHVWLKPVHAPDLALKLPLQPQDFDYATRTDATPIAGSRFPTATWDVLQAPTSQITVITRDRQTEKALLRLLDQGPIFGQWPACAGVDDHYFLPDKVSSEELHWDGYPMRRWTIGTITIARPATTESALIIPGLSYDTVAADFDTYDQVAEQVESYNRLLEVS